MARKIETYSHSPFKYVLNNKGVETTYQSVLELLRDNEDLFSSRSLIYRMLANGGTHKKIIGVSIKMIV